MLRSMQLENFKAFGQRTVIPVAPITLVFGQNSAGKSSILQALNLLKQTRESRDAEALLQPRTEGGFVDLGSFQEMLFDHDLSRRLAIRLEIDTPNKRDFSPFFFRFLPDQPSISVELTFVRPTLQDEISTESLVLFHGQTKVAKFTPAEINEESIHFGSHFRMRLERRGYGTIRAMRCVEVTDSVEYWDKMLELTLKHRERLLKACQETRNSLSHRKSRQAADLFSDTDGKDKRHKAFQKLDEAIRLLSGEPTKQQLLDWYRTEQLGTLIGLDGFLPMLFAFQDDEPSLEQLLARFSRRSVPTESFPDVSRLAMMGGMALERCLSALFPLGPFRKPPSRLYIFTGTTPQDVGYAGQLLPDLLFRQPELVAKANEWLKRLDIGYELLIRSVGKDMTDLFEVRLRDKRREKDVLVGLSDVGFGISQILPLVVQSLAAQDQIITIEQPEVHIHPRLQADLGDLMIEAIQKPRRNQFIIETHSEHLALRLQRRVREKKLSPKDISVVYVSRGPNGATVQPLRLDEEGDFIDAFPGGFFPERLRELR